MDLLMIFAYLLPIVFLAAFAGSMNRRSILFLGWGFFASIPAIILENSLLKVSPESFVPTVTIAPVVEEFFIVLPLVIFFAIGTRMSKRDTLACAMASGIGFSIIENYSQVAMTPGLTFILIVVLSAVRSFSTTVMHGCTCAIIGYGLVLIRDVHRTALPALFFGFYTVAVMIHALFNLLGYKDSSGNFIFGDYGIIADFILPFSLYLFLLICYQVDLHSLFRPDPDE
jgi:RsiW-degrading membrane proteinase PrsW (M82 family)